MAGAFFSPYIPAIQTLLAGMTGITGFPARILSLLQTFAKNNIVKKVK